MLLGVTEGDSVDDARHLVDKTVNLRVFPDDVGRFNRSLLEVNGSLMVVSQFTLYADTRKGRRPSFVRAAQPEVAEPLYEQAVALFREACPTVVTGVFGGHMVVEIHNDGPSPSCWTAQTGRCRGGVRRGRHWCGEASVCPEGNRRVPRTD